LWEDDGGDGIKAVAATGEIRMGRIIASVKIENLEDPQAKVRCDALVGTGTSHMVLPIIGYVILEQSQAAVDMLGHRLIPMKRMDLK
jgi:hypothetical protein